MGPLHAERLATGTAVLLDGRGRVLLTRCHVAGRPLARLVGLLATGRLRPGEGLLLRPCRSVHAVGLRPAIGVALLDAAG
ncbi:MAG: hypothetical protein MUE51_15695, partial [Thermoleophilia bacterium]|nr:hypothetical protein [Thermoleophilia bacterium]